MKQINDFTFKTVDEMTGRGYLIVERLRNDVVSNKRLHCLNLMAGFKCYSNLSLKCG